MVEEGRRLDARPPPRTSRRQAFGEPQPGSIPPHLRKGGFAVRGSCVMLNPYIHMYTCK